VTITDDMIARGSYWLSLRNGITIDPRGGPATPPPPPPPDSGANRFFYPSSHVTIFQARMAGGAGPYYSTGDVTAGSPNDGARAVTLKNNFMANPTASHWVQPVPWVVGSPTPGGEANQRFLQAAWCYMTLPSASDRNAVGAAVKTMLLTVAQHPNNDWSNSSNYAVNQNGPAASPMWDTPSYLVKVMKARDMLGRGFFSSAENAIFDQWLYGIANYFAKWLHIEGVGKYVPGRLTRNYTTVTRAENAVKDGGGPGGMRSSYDGGPGIGLMGLTYTNRHATPANALAYAANYLKYYGYSGNLKSNPSYGTYTIDELLFHSTLYVEESIRFGVYPQGFQGDFERGDQVKYSASKRQGWLYSINVANSLVSMADAHAKRGDMSLWNYGTTAGYDGTAGAPTVGGFTTRNLHFYVWSMVRYVNDAWGRRNYSAHLAKDPDNIYHDVIPAAVTNRYFPADTTLQAAWKRVGQSFPAYPTGTIQSQGAWHAHYGDRAKFVGLIEVGGL
jgi:hypothetical protein